MNLLKSRYLPVIWGLALALLASPRPSPAEDATLAEPWNEAPFTADPAAVLQAADTISAEKGADVLVLLEEARCSFDAQHRLAFTYRLVYRVLTPVGLQGWSKAGIAWSPWYQERPTLRARVISPDGMEHRLDPATVGEFPIGADHPDILSDRRILQAPLPAVSVGAVVEEESIVRDVSPLLESGTVHTFGFGKQVPVHRTRLVLEAPATLSLRYVKRLLPAVEPRHSETDERVRWTFEAGPLEALEPFEALTPADSPVQPVVGFSTGESWARVAGRYAEIVDAKIAGAELDAIVEQATRGAETRQEKIAALLAWLQAEVRYTGLEFGETAIVPRSPAQTLARKYGDCKDKAALLVALLREAAIPAHVALLNTGPGPDVESELPGFGAFDHAVVLVPGAPDVWIDPTDEFARAGELPLWDQSRLALIAAPETAGLISTPVATSEENRSVMTREIFLAPDLGGGRVVLSTRAWGSIERNYRRFYSQSDPADLEEVIETHAKTAYAAEELTAWSHSDPRDLSTPFEIRVEMRGATTAFTDLANATVAINRASLLEFLPAPVLESGDEGEASSQGSSTTDATARPRKSDLVLFEPYVQEWHHRIFPPPGYTAGSLPETEISNLGPATLSSEVAVEDEGVVALTWRFDTGKRRLSPEEVEAFREAVRDLREADPVLVSFEHVGETLVATGRIREALDELKRLAALAADRALPRTRIARALLAAGLGDAARREAREAVEMEPDLDLAHQTLGIVLTHDLLGRHLQGGFDQEAAIEALRRAKELDPENGVTRQNLAILLEHDREGVRYGSAARLDEAIAEYRSLREELGETGLDENLLILLARSRRFEECIELARELSPSPARNAMLAVAVAATEGAAAAIKESLEIDDVHQRQAGLLAAGWVSAQLRLYPQAAELLSSAARGAPGAVAILGQADVLGKARPYEELSLDEDDPATAVRRLWIAAFVGEDDDAPTGLFSRRLSKDQTAGEVAEIRKVTRLFRPSLRTTGMPIESLLDVVLAGLKVKAEGEDRAGYRVRAGWSFGAESQDGEFFVVRDEAGYRLLTSENLAVIGEEASRRLEAGDPAAARQWLDWARDQTQLPSADDPFAGEPFPRFWTRGSEGGPDEIRAAAASLVAGGENAESALPILERGRELATSEHRRRSFELALARAYTRLERHADLLAIARGWLVEKPDSVGAFYGLRVALAGMERWQDYGEAAEERLALLPEDPSAIRALSRSASRDGDPDRRDELLRRLVAAGEANAGDFNRLAWSAVVRGDVTEQALEHARQAAGRRQSHAILHTLAAIYAELGKNSEAREVLLQAMTVGGYDEPLPEDWYVWGRIAENYGETAAAAEAYRRVEKPEGPEELETSSYRVAERRLKALAAGIPSPPDALSSPTTRAHR